MSLVTFLFPRKKKSASTAKERLLIVIASERVDGTNPTFKSALRDDLAEVLSKYTKVNLEDITVSFSRRGNLEVSATIVVIPKT